MGPSPEAFAERMPLDDEGRIVNFSRDIAPILVRRCYECHNEDEAKGYFQVDDGELFLDYVEPGDAEVSTVFADYMTAQDDDMLMPPRGHDGPMSPAELSLIRVWINEGADWPDNVVVAPRPAAGDEDGEAGVGETVADQADAVAEVALSLPWRVYAAQGFLHPATVHFPIALLLVGAAFVVIGWRYPTVGTQIPVACLLLGAVSSLAASMMGWSLAETEGYPGWSRFDESVLDGEFFWHRWGGVVVTAVSLVLAVVSLVAVGRTRAGKESVALSRTWKIGLLVTALMVGAVGHQGGELTYGPDFYPKAWRILVGDE